MRSESLDRKVILQRAAVAQDATGQVIETWDELATVWASRRRASAREVLAAAEVAGSVSDVFEVRYSSTIAGLTVKDRLLHGGRVYDIASVDEIDRRVGLRIAAFARAELPIDETDDGDETGEAMLDFSAIGNSQYIGLLEDI